MERSQLAVLNNKLTLVKEPIQVTEGIQLTPDERQYMLPHFTMLLIGKPGSGKTSMIKQLMNNEQLYKDKFNDTLLVSPSYQKMGLTQVRERDQTAQFSLSWIFERFDQINQEQLLIQQRLLNDIDFEMDGEYEYSTNGMKTKSKLGVSADIYESNSKLVDRLYSGQSRFFGVSNRPQASTIIQLQQQQHIQNPQRLGLPPKAQQQKRGRNDTQFAHEMRKLQEEAELQAKMQQQKNYEQLMTLSQEERRAFYRNVVLILDDVVGDIKKNETNPLLAQLIMNRRHLIHNGMLSIIIVSQKYTMIPARVRSNANWLLLFKLNPLDIETVYRDSVNLNRDQWHSLVNFVFTETEDQGNITDWMNNKKYDNLSIFVEFDMYFKNFKQIKF